MFCPTCHAEAEILITDRATGKRYCFRCLPEAGEVSKVAAKIEGHIRAGTLESYPLEDRLRELQEGEKIN